MYALLAFIPILFCVVVMAVLNWPAKFAMPISWLITAVLGFTVWKVDILSVIAYSFSGLFFLTFFSSFPTYNNKKARPDKSGRAVIARGTTQIQKLLSAL